MPWRCQTYLYSAGSLMAGPIYKTIYTFVKQYTLDFYYIIFDYPVKYKMCQLSELLKITNWLSNVADDMCSNCSMSALILWNFVLNSLMPCLWNVGTINSLDVGGRGEGICMYHTWESKLCNCIILKWEDSDWEAGNRTFIFHPRMFVQSKCYQYNTYYVVYLVYVH